MFLAETFQLDHKSDKTAFEREENGPKIVEKRFIWLMNSR